jgi:hypothetical protein
VVALLVGLGTMGVAQVIPPDDCTSGYTFTATPTDESPTVSVVVPTYRRTDRLRVALASAIGSSHSPAEIIVVDGDDDGRAAPVAREFGARHLRQADHGADSVDGVVAVADARDVGVSAATGEYVRFLDDDDRLREDAIEKQLALAESDDDVGVVYCGIEREDGPVTLPHGEVRGDVLEHALRLQVPPCVPSTMLVRRSCLERIPEMRTLPHDDAALRIELARITEFDFVDEPLVFRGASEDALAGSPSSVEGRKKTFVAYDSLYDQFPPDVRKTALMRTHFQAGQLYLHTDGWSPRSIRALALANYHAPEFRVELFGSLIAALFGRPGWRAGVALYNAISGNERRGVAGDVF